MNEYRAFRRTRSRRKVQEIQGLGRRCEMKEPAGIRPDVYKLKFLT